MIWRTAKHCDSSYLPRGFRITMQDITPTCSETSCVWIATAPKRTSVRSTDQELLFHCDLQTRRLQKVQLESAPMIYAIITAHKTIQRTPLIRDNGAYIMQVNCLQSNKWSLRLVLAQVTCAALSTCLLSSTNITYKLIQFNQWTCTQCNTDMMTERKTTIT